MAILHRTTYLIIHNDTYNVIRIWKVLGGRGQIKCNNTVLSLNNDYIGCTLKILQLINKPYMYPAHKIIAT